MSDLEPAEAPYVPKRRHAGLAWWMIAIAKPRYARIRGETMAGPPEDVPWLLILRAYRTSVMPEVVAWAMIAASAVASYQVIFGDSTTYDLRENFPFFWNYVLILSHVNAFVCPSATLFQNLDKHAATFDFATLPIPPNAWLKARLRLFAVVVFWGAAIGAIPYVLESPECLAYGEWRRAQDFLRGFLIVVTFSFAVFCVQLIRGGFYSVCLIGLSVLSIFAVGRPEPYELLFQLGFPLQTLRSIYDMLNKGFPMLSIVLTATSVFALWNSPPITLDNYCRKLSP